MFVNTKRHIERSISVLIGI